MTTYLNIIHFNFLRFLAYPHEIAAALLKWALEIGFILLFWLVVAKSSNGALDINQLLIYFILANSIDVIINTSRLTFSKYINYMIKFGEISNYLTKPISIIPYLYATYLGKDGLSLLISLITLIIGLVISLPISSINFVLFLLFLALAMIISFSINLMVGLLAFYTPEAMGIRFTVSHIMRVFSGAIIPLTFFPENIRSFLSLTFLPGMVYTPTAIITGHIGGLEAINALVVSAFWAILLFILAFYLWGRALKNYDAVGI